MTAPRTRSTVARLIRPCDTILNPLDPRSTVYVVDVYKSDFSTTVELTVMVDDKLGSMTLEDEQPVRRVR